MSNIAQFLGSGSFPVGGSVPMPTLSTQSSFTTSSNELYVNSTNPTIIPASSCNSVLAATSNDLIMTSTQTSLMGFQMVGNAISSNNYSGLIGTPLAQLGTKAFYVGSTYYFFSPSDTNGNTIGFISTTDLVNYTPFVQITPCANLAIVDIFYNTTNSTWYFLEANGNIIAMTNLNTFAGLTSYYLPNLSVSNGYRKLTYINSVWYAIGGSTTGTGYRISSSSNLTSWTTVIENTSATAPAISICQGAGSGSSTEILVGCANDTILKSTNNGTSFTATTTTTGLTSAIIKQVFYSSRTGLYYLAATGSNTSTTGAYIIVSTTSTLTTAAWTNYYSGLGTNTSVTSTASNIDVIDTGTNVGITFTNTSLTHNFYYGASYNTASANIMTTAQTQQLDTTSTSLSTAKSFWLNNTLITIYSNSYYYPAAYATSNRGNCWIITSNGATAASSITASLMIPNTVNYYTAAYNQNMLMTGLTYLSGSYYAGWGAPVLTTGQTCNALMMYLIKINSSFTTFSCPYTPAVCTATSSFLINMASNQNLLFLSSGRLNGAGTSINWVGFFSSGNITQTSNFSPVFTFNGTALSYVGNLPTSAGTAGSGGTYSGTIITNQPSATPSLPKWSSLYSAYVYASPCIALDSSATTLSAIVATNTSLTGTASPLISYPCDAANKYATVTSIDILSNGMIVSTGGINNNTTYYLYVATGNAVVSLTNNTTGIFALWEIVYGGSSYLVAISNVSGTNTLSIWKLNINGPVEIVIQSYSVTNLSIPYVGTNPAQAAISVLRRVISYNGSFILADALPTNTVSRNSLMLTPSNGGFTISQVYLYIGSEYAPTGLANTYTTMNTVTSVNPTPVPAVYIPAGTANNFVKVR